MRHTALVCPHCGAAAPGAVVYPWPPVPSRAGDPLAVRAAQPGFPWRCRACVDAADAGGRLSRRLRRQAQLMNAGAMVWPR